MIDGATSSLTTTLGKAHKAMEAIRAARRRIRAGTGLSLARSFCVLFCLSLSVLPTFVIPFYGLFSSPVNSFAGIILVRLP